MEENRILTGAEVRKRRHYVGMTQRALAASANVSLSTVEALELGKRSARETTLAKLLWALDRQEAVLTASATPAAPAASQPDKLLRVEDVAARLDVPTSWVYHAAKEQLIPSVRVGYYVRFRAADIEEWIAQGGRSAGDA